MGIMKIKRIRRITQESYMKDMIYHFNDLWLNDTHATQVMLMILIILWAPSTIACPPLLTWGMSRWWACCIHAYTMNTPIGEKGRCSTRSDLEVHHMQASKCADERTTLALKTHGEGHMKSKLGPISGSIKWTLVQQNFLKNCES